jgi:hypothetical protein
VVVAAHPEDEGLEAGRSGVVDESGDHPPAQTPAAASGWAMTLPISALWVNTGAGWRRQRPMASILLSTLARVSAALSLVRVEFSQVSVSVRVGGVR